MSGPPEVLSVRNRDLRPADGSNRRVHSTLPANDLDIFSYHDESIQKACVIHSEPPFLYLSEDTTSGLCHVSTHVSRLRQTSNGNNDRPFSTDESERGTRQANKPPIITRFLRQHALSPRKIPSASSKLLISRPTSVRQPSEVAEEELYVEGLAAESRGLRVRQRQVRARWRSYQFFKPPADQDEEQRQFPPSSGGPIAINSRDLEGFPSPPSRPQ
ncbi:hypothetical protein GWK47_002669 [Chionoecetes opilio]|uniref:Uncharacterized protein n=1 Tax=Chionoecetes opilio TaxID=41210 RepID=A0A8J4XMJ1_CHIOP|nr:hypothetical protein GWK47_002669 [Chionoecetes opilio]